MHHVLPRGPVQDSNLGPIISIISWILIACSGIAVAIKLFLWTLATRRFLAEDAAILASLALSIAYTAAISWASEHGLGQYDRSLSPGQVAGVQRALYASEILLVPLQACSQVSIALFLYQVTPYRRHQICLQVIGAVVGLFAVSSLFAVSFQCSAPHFTQILQPACFDQQAFWTAYGAISIALELCFVALPSWIVSAVHVDLSRKLTITACFAFRLAVVAAWIAALAERPAAATPDYLHAAWRYYLCVVVVQAAAVITQCIPYIRNLLVGVESGMIRTGDFRLRAPSKTHASADAPSSGRKPSAGWCGELGAIE